MNTSKWGPHAWFFIHSTAYNYPMNPTPVQQNNIKVFFESLQHILPCVYCRATYSTYIRVNPLTQVELKDNDSLNRWVWQLHSYVNKKLNKPNISYEQMRQKYEQVKAK
jgi:hypothetical protein